MRLSWNEVRSRAAAFAQEWQGTTYEKGETQSFYNDFFDLFGVKRRTVARYEAHVAKLETAPALLACSGRGCSSSNRKVPGGTWAPPTTRPVPTAMHCRSGSVPATSW